MVRIAAGFLPLVLASCISWPDIPESASVASSEWPSLAPLDEIGEDPVDLDREMATERLIARSERLRARADLLRRPVADDDAMERLRQSISQ